MQEYSSLHLDFKLRYVFDFYRFQYQKYTNN